MKVVLDWLAVIFFLYVVPLFSCKLYIYMDLCDNLGSERMLKVLSVIPVFNIISGLYCSTVLLLKFTFEFFAGIYNLVY